MNLHFIFKVIIMLYIFNINIYCQSEKGYIDTVYSYNFTESQTIGQSPDFFPENIFGPPSKIASATTQAASDSDVVSLGRNGWIVVGFKNKFIIDKKGTDFTIFENAFINNATKKIFAEPAKIAVSQDGINYIEFPYNEATLVGCAGVNPVYGSNNPFDPSQSGGDKFDLKDVGLTYAKYIKITDISMIVTKDSKHKYFQPEGMVLGFDLDAVAGLNLSNKEIAIVENDKDLEIIQIDNSIIILNNSILTYDLFLYNYLGVCIKEIQILPNININISNIKSGLYFFNAISSRGIIRKKIII